MTLTVVIPSTRLSLKSGILTFLSRHPCHRARVRDMLAGGASVRGGGAVPGVMGWCGHVRSMVGHRGTGPGGITVPGPLLYCTGTTTVPGPLLYCTGSTTGLSLLYRVHYWTVITVPGPLLYRVHYCTALYRTGSTTVLHCTVPPLYCTRHCTIPGTVYTPRLHPRRHPPWLPQEGLSLGGLDGLWIRDRNAAHVVR